MSNKCFILAGLLTILCTIETVRRLRKAQDVKFPIVLTTTACILLLVTGMVLNFTNR